MGRQFAFRHIGRGQPAQVDDALYARSASPLGKHLGGLPVGLLEVVSGPQGMHEVVGDIDTAQSAPDRIRIGHIPANRLGVLCPRMVAQLVRRPGHAPYAVPGVQQFGDQSASDIPRRACHQTVQASRVPAAHGSLRSAGVLPLSPLSTDFAHEARADVVPPSVGAGDRDVWAERRVSGMRPCAVSACCRRGGGGFLPCPVRFQQVVTRARQHG